VLLEEPRDLRRGLVRAERHMLPVPVECHRDRRVPRDSRQDRSPEVFLIAT
jgi:hypothetical protein